MTPQIKKIVDLDEIKKGMQNILGFVSTCVLGPYKVDKDANNDFIVTHPDVKYSVTFKGDTIARLRQASLYAFSREIIPELAEQNIKFIDIIQMQRDALLKCADPHYKAGLAKECLEETNKMLGEMK